MRCVLLSVLAFVLVTRVHAQGESKTTPRPLPAVERLLNDALAEGTTPAERVLALGIALSKAKELHDVEGQGVALSCLGQIDAATGRNEEAIDAYGRAATLFDMAGDPISEALTLMWSSSAFAALGRYEKAIDACRKSLDLYRAHHDLKSEVSLEVRLGKLLVQHEDYLPAIDVLKGVLPKLGPQDDDLLRPAALADLANAYNALGKRQIALEYATRAVDLSKNAKDPSIEPYVLEVLAAVQMGLGQKLLAKERYERSLSLFHRLGDPQEEARATNNLAYVLGALGRKEEQIVKLNSSLPLWRAAKDREGEASTLNNLASAYQSVGNGSEAWSNVRQALTIFREIGSRSGIAFALANLGELSTESGRPTEALTEIDEAITTFRLLGDRDGEATALVMRSQALLGLRAFDLAIVQQKLSVNLRQGLRRDIKGLPQEVQRTFLAQNEDVYHSLATLLIARGRIAEAQKVLDLLKDDEYFQFLRASSASTVDLTPREATWRLKYEAAGDALAKASQEYDALTLKAGTGALTPAEREFRARLESRVGLARVAFETFLTESRAAFADAKAKDRRLDEVENNPELADQLAKMPGTAGIYTLITQDGVRTILTLPRVTEVKAGPAQRIPYDEFLKKVALLRRALADDRYDPRPVAADLYDILIRPIENELTGASVKRLLWSLDGPLRYVPLAALYDRKTGKYLMEKYPCGLFVPAKLTKLADAPTRRPTGAGFGVTKGRTVDGEAFPELHAVDGEMAALRTQLGASVDEDGRFTVARLKETIATKRPAIVHLATHFRLRPGDAERSFLLLGQGTLTVADFAHWAPGALRGTDILVLSACDTATPLEGDQGDKGDGGEFESFARVALTNGAASVLASLWSVDDASTALLMSKLYELRKTQPALPKLEALRQAQRWLMTANTKAGPTHRTGSSNSLPKDSELKLFPRDSAHPFAHPHFWAPFVLTGNPR